MQTPRDSSFMYIDRTTPLQTHYYFHIYLEIWLHVCVGGLCPTACMRMQQATQREVLKMCVKEKPNDAVAKVLRVISVIHFFERWRLRQRPPPRMLPQKVQRRHPSPSPKHLPLWPTICFPTACQITSSTIRVEDTSTTHGPHVPIAVRYHRMPPKNP